VRKLADLLDLDPEVLPSPDVAPVIPGHRPDTLVLALFRPAAHIPDDVWRGTSRTDSPRRSRTKVLRTMSSFWCDIAGLVSPLAIATGANRYGSAAAGQSERSAALLRSGAQGCRKSRQAAASGV
jgi:hypothetical protein